HDALPIFQTSFLPYREKKLYSYKVILNLATDLLIKHVMQQYRFSYFLKNPPKRSPKPPFFTALMASLIPNLPSPFWSNIEAALPLVNDPKISVILKSPLFALPITILKI